jgi:fermentation-respiration switch protein FrsA (DUF1100 family)
MHEARCPPGVDAWRVRPALARWTVHQGRPVREGEPCEPHARWLKSSQIGVPDLRQTVNLPRTSYRAAVLYIQHGARDDLIPVSQAERLVREARNAERLVLQIEPEGNHCCHNLYHVTRHAMADFLAETLDA